MPNIEEDTPPSLEDEVTFITKDDQEATYKNYLRIYGENATPEQLLYGNKEQFMKNNKFGLKQQGECLDIWDDKKFLKDMSSVTFVVPSLMEIRHLTQQFLDFYINGIIPTLDVTHLILSIILSTPDPFYRLQKEKLFSEKFKDKGARLPALMGVYTSSPDAFTMLEEATFFIQQAETLASATTSGTFSLMASQKNRQNFLTFISEALVTDDKNLGILQEYLGHLCLLTMRVITNSAKTLRNVLDYRARDLFLSLWNNPMMPDTFPSASETYISTCVTEFGNQKPQSKTLLGPILEKYIKSCLVNYSPYSSLLMGTCLHHLAGNGLGLISFSEDVLFHLQWDFDTMLDRFGYEGFSESMLRLKKFRSIHCVEGRLQHGWKWARIIDNRYFTDLNIDANKWTCLHLAYILADENPGILETVKIKSMPEDQKAMAKEWAHDLMNDVNARRSGVIHY